MDIPTTIIPRASVFVPALLCLTFGAGAWLLPLGDGTIEVDPNRKSPRWSSPEYNGGSPTLTSGFKDWELCDLGGRIETLPSLFSLPRWGPAALTSASGCSTCGGTVTFNGDPKTAGLGLALAPPHDFHGDPGELPPAPNDHAYVMADTGEVVYSEVDFVIKGQGFDFVWARTYRSAYEFEGWFGYGWSHGAELYLAESASSGNVTATLGDGRTSDLYTEDAGVYTSPDGRWDKLEKGTRGSGYTPSKYALQPYFTKTEKNGIVWEFDYAVTAGKVVYHCTSITDTWGNAFTLEYDNTDTVRLTKVTDVEGHEATFTYDAGNDFITKVTVANTETDTAYGDVVIDYTYNVDGTLKKVEKQKTRQSDGGTVVRPYTEYSYYTTGNRDNNLQKVYYSNTTDAAYDFVYTDAAEDRCTQVTDADGEVHKYDHNETDLTDYWTKYTDPSNQRRDFVYEDYAGGDRTIAEVREYLEDEDGDDLAGHYDLEITRDCDCGQITDLTYSDGSKEEWEYDSDGNVTKYTRTPKSLSTETSLVKKWTYASFANYSRVLTTSGWLRAEANPSTKVTYAWDSDGGLDTVTWPTVTTGVSSSQTIVYDYEIGADGVLDWIEDPEDNRTAFSYSGLTLTTTKGSGTSDTMVTKEERDEMGNVVMTESHLGVTSQWDYTVTPDGRVLKADGPDNQERKWEYDLQGRQTKAKTLLAASTWVTHTNTLSTGSRVTQVKADDGGKNLISIFDLEEAEASRYSQSLDPLGYGSRQQWGYGSHGLPWKTFNVDDSGGSTVTTLTSTLERDTMGRVVTEVLQGGTEIDYVYDDFGRLIETHEDLPSSKTRKTILTLKDWGAVEKTEIKEGSTVHATTTNYFDEAIRQYKVVQEDPDNVLADRVVEMERDKNGRVKIRTNVRGGDTTTDWFADGRVKKVTGPEGNEIKYAYSDASKTMTRTDRQKDTSDSTFTEYDVVTTYLASGAIDKVKNEGSASGDHTTDYSYDYALRRTQVKTPLGAETDYEYDALGRMTKQTVDINATDRAETTYTYDDGGRKTKVTDANSKYTTWTYDSFGRELTTNILADSTPDPDTLQTTTKTYDTYGRLSTVTDPEGVVKTYNYDIASRMYQLDINKASSGLGGPDRLTYVFDDMDRVTSAKTQKNNSGTYSDLTSVTRAYDGYGRMDSETQHGSRTVSYAHDEGGAVKEITFPSGGPIVGVKYTIDDLGRVTGVDRKLSTAVEGISTSAWEATASFEYEGYREIERTQTKYDLERTQSWTSFRRPEALRYEEDSTNTLRTGYKNTWDKDGYIKVRERTHDHDGTYAWGEVYRYDEMGRLTDAWTDVRNPANFVTTNPTSSDQHDDHIEWNLGEVFERDSVVTTPKGGGGTTVDFDADESYKYTKIGPTAGNLTWDDNGQLTDWDTTDYSWTALGQMEQADVFGETARDYTYDAFGRRVSTKLGSADTHLLYHGWHMIGAYDVVASDWLWQEIPMNRGDGMLEHIALDTYDRDSDTNTTEYRQYAVHEDWQNTVWALSDTAGDLVEEYRQGNPFGSSESFDASSTSLGDFASKVYHYKRMHGGVVEEVSKLYDFRNRWYSPKAGAWLSRDSLGQVDSENLMQAMGGNPLTFIDPFGLRIQHMGTVDIGGAGLSEIDFYLVSPYEPSEDVCDENEFGCTVPELYDEDEEPPFKMDVTLYVNCDGASQEECNNRINEEIGHAVVFLDCAKRCKDGASGYPDLVEFCLLQCEDADILRGLITDGPGGHHDRARRKGKLVVGPISRKIRRTVWGNRSDAEQPPVEFNPIGPGAPRRINYSSGVPFGGGEL